MRRVTRGRGWRARIAPDALVVLPPRVGPASWRARAAVLPSFASSGAAWRVLVALTLLQGAAATATQGLGWLAPFFRDEFSLTKAQIGILFAAASAGAGLSSIPGGWIGDRVPSRWVFLIGPLFSGVTLVAASGARGYWELAATLVLAGSATGLVVPSITSTVADQFPARGRATAMGIKQSAIPLISAAAALLLPSVAVASSWRVALLVVAAAVAATALLGRYAARPFNAAAKKPPSPRDISKAGLLRSRALLSLILVSFVGAGVQLTLVSYTVLFLQDQFQLTAITAGWFLGVGGLMAVVGRLGAGVLSDFSCDGRRLGVLRAVLAISTIGLVLLAWLPPSLPLVLVAVLLGLLFMAGYGWNTVSSIALVELAGPRAAATAVGVSIAASFAGMLVLPPAFGALVDASQAYEPAWLGLGAIELGTLGLLLSVRERSAAD